MDFFNLDVPNRDPDTLGEKMSANYHLYMKQVRRMYAENPSLGSIAFFQADRCPLREYHSAITWDIIPALRTQGPQIFAVSTKDLHLPWHLMKLHRFLEPGERFSFQGHDAEYALACGSKTFAHLSTGNAYGTPQVAAMLVPLLEQAVATGVIQKSGLSKLSETELFKLSSFDWLEGGEQQGSPKKRQRCDPAGT